MPLSSLHDLTAAIGRTPLVALQRLHLPPHVHILANPLAHYQSTGPEIWEQSAGKVTHFVAGMGTSGTLMGAGRFLKETNPAIEIVGIEPRLGHKVQGLKNMKEPWRSPRNWRVA